MPRKQNQQHPPARAREKILAAAREEFVEKGLSGARMQAIAERAGTNKALLHYYYSSKQQLYEAALESILSGVWEALERNLASIDQTGDPRTVVRTLVATCINTFRASPGFPQLLLRELADGAETAPRIVQVVLLRFAHLVSRVTGVMANAAKAGVLRHIDPAQAVTNIVGMSAASFIFRPVITTLHDQVLHRSIAFDDEYYAARIEAITDMAFDGIAAKEARR